MIRRVIAAAVALLLAAVGIVLVLNYANRADERALAGQETVQVLIAADGITQGESGDDKAKFEVRQIPRAYVVPGALDSLDDVDGLVAATSLTQGQQVVDGTFVSAEDLRGRGAYAIPEEAQDLHQLTISLANPQALGGSIAPGDTVGLFSTFELKPPTGWVIGPDGELQWDPDAARSNDSGSEDGQGGSDGGGSGGGDETVTFTDLVLDKVLVVRVEGGFVASSGEGGDGAAQDTIHITLALEPQDAARVIQTVQTGNVWLTLSPEGAKKADIDAVIPAAPTRVTGVLE